MPSFVDIAHRMPTIFQTLTCVADRCPFSWMQIRGLRGTALPGHLKYGNWNLAYCTHRDGYSLHTLYRKAAGRAHTLLVVKDTGECRGGGRRTTTMEDGMMQWIKMGLLEWDGGLECESYA